MKCFSQQTPKADNSCRRFNKLEELRDCVPNFENLLQQVSDAPDGRPQRDLEMEQNSWVVLYTSNYLTQRKLSLLH